MLIFIYYIYLFILFTSSHFINVSLELFLNAWVKEKENIICFWEDCHKYLMENFYNHKEKLKSDSLGVHLKIFVQDNRTN